MKIFSKTTKNLFIGFPEAEREANIKSKVKLEEVFEDFLGVFPNIESGNFIITGRKGSGKSAIGQIIKKRSKNNPNEFCEYIQKSDIDIEEIVQFSESTENVIQKEILFKWIILTRILKLITENEAVQDLKEIKIIKHFLRKNSGFVNIDKYEIKEILRTTGFDIAIEKLLQFFRFKAKDEMQLKGSKAPFYKLIPHLEFIVKTILTSSENRLNENKYTIIFDDLDIEFKAEKKKHVETLLNLIRITKNYNNNLFSDNDIDAKVLILLRDDISDVLIKKSADMSKIFNSYSTNLTWFEYDIYKKDENLTLLKRFIDSRISYAARNKGDDCGDNPWNFLIEENSKYNESSFKYVIDHTFYTPRDLILFFLDIQKYQYNLPLQLHEINSLIGKYAIRIKEELENALVIHLEFDQINRVFEILRRLACYNDFTMEDFDNICSKCLLDSDNKTILSLLYDYSMIGNRNSKGKVFFKHREKFGEKYKLNFDQKFVLHRIFLIYFQHCEG